MATMKYETIKPYNIETLHISDGDVIILHLANNLGLDDINYIKKDIQSYFPNNQVLCANEHILKSITVVKKENNPFIDMDLDLEWLK
jgi:hypothetical protein